MLQMTNYVLLAGTLPAVALSAALALAHDPGGMMDRGGVMGGHDRGGIMGNGRSTMTRSGMEGCMQMMQGMHGAARPPNEQWRQRWA
jgi:hypothetical protein